MLYAPKSEQVQIQEPLGAQILLLHMLMMVYILYNGT